MSSETTASPEAATESPSFAALSIAESDHHETFILSALVDIMKDVEADSAREPETEDEVLDVEELESELEAKLCQLWDLSVDEAVCQKLFQLKATNVFYFSINGSRKPRLVEIVTGILGNMFCCASVQNLLANDQEFASTVLGLLSRRDTGILSEALRICEAVIRLERQDFGGKLDEVVSSSSADVLSLWSKQWLPKFVESDCLSELQFMLISCSNGSSNSMSQTLLVSESLERLPAAALEALNECLKNNYHSAANALLQCLQCIVCMQELELNENALYSFFEIAVNCLNSMVLNCDFDFMEPVESELAISTTDLLVALLRIGHSKTSVNQFLLKDVELIKKLLKLHMKLYDIDVQYQCYISAFWKSLYDCITDEERREFGKTLTLEELEFCNFKEPVS